MKIKQATPAPAFPPVTIVIETRQELDELGELLDGLANRSALGMLVDGVRVARGLELDSVTVCPPTPALQMDPLWHGIDAALDEYKRAREDAQ